MTADEIPPVRMSEPRWTWQRLVRLALILLALYFVGWLFWSARSSLTPFALGLVAAYLLQPIVRRLANYMPRGLAILVVYLVGFGLLIGGSMLIIPAVFQQTSEFVNELPGWYTNDVQPQVTNWMRWYNENTPPEVKQTVEEQILNAQNTLKENASSYVSGITRTLLNTITSVFSTIFFLLGFLIIPFWLFYVLLDQDKGKVAIDKLLPDAIRSDVWAILGIFDRIFSSYIRGQLILGAIVATFSFVGLSILKLAGVNVQYIMLLSLVAGLTELIPVIGPVLGAIPAIIVGFFDSPSAALWIALLYVIVQQIENNVLVPRIIGEVVEIHPSILMVLLVIAGAIWGLLGVILVAPLAAIVRDVFLYIYRRLQVSEEASLAERGAPPTQRAIEAHKAVESRNELVGDAQDVPAAQQPEAS